jgi:hypothetical protein
MAVQAVHVAALPGLVAAVAAEAVATTAAAEEAEAEGHPTSSQARLVCTVGKAEKNDDKRARRFQLELN